MNFLKNRTVLGVICIAIALVICFAITPLFNASKNSTTEIVRMKKDVKIGQEITAKDVEIVEVGGYNLPSGVIKKTDEVVGKYVASELLSGEYILPSKISDTPASENAYLYNLTGEKRAISVSIPSFAQGLSGKLMSGDIVSIIACDYEEKGETVVPDELQYVEVIAATDKKGNDEGEVVVTADGEEEADLPSTITLLVTPKQANILAALEAEGEIHVTLVYRGTTENAAKFIKAQDKILAEKSADETSEPTNEATSEETDITEESENFHVIIPPIINEETTEITSEITDETDITEEIENAELSE